MPTYVDTEFNGFNGELISMALVTPQGSEWYECLELPQNLTTFVKEKVVPFINKSPITKEEFAQSLQAFLMFHKGKAIIADWPEDLMHVMKFTYGTDGKQLNLDYTCKLIISGRLDSKIPHNALEDARALMHWHQEQIRITPQDTVLA